MNPLKDAAEGLRKAFAPIQAAVSKPRGPDDDLEHFQLPLRGRAFLVEEGAPLPLEPRDGSCVLRLPEFKEATPAEVADLGARIQRAVDEWSSARAGKSVYEHTGRRYEP